MVPLSLGSQQQVPPHSFVVADSHDGGWQQALASGEQQGPLQIAATVPQSSRPQ